MKVTREDINALFVAIGVEEEMVTKWPPARLQKKIAGLPDICDDDTDAGDQQELLDKILEALEEDEEIEVTAAKKSKTSKASKTGGKGKGKTSSKGKGKKAAADEDDDEPDDDDEEPDDDEPDDDEPDDDEEEKPKKSSKKKKSSKATKKVTKKPKKENKSGPKKVGVIATIVEVLKKSSKSKPVTKDAICEVLEERFPDRDPASMMRTINVQVPNRLKSDKGLEIEKVVKGDKAHYFISRTKKG